ncbi:sensor histidine kinase [Clostridium saccharobutylicum]|uniref:histidine kinase n=4 Tax=Clostridium saccharobutylicum TaxID=169679 RepID=U5MQD8_CLOSA|nr:HAMP domain-containing sensor histidine kinase [Clostridium saccharobutylicum]AGX42999.1 ATPase/histidine kinase/DNA gyrase B/HSP90 domain protein [Clostridium saccharobutylicum DSM 13864]AQR90290.1 alkaline phosphatase synthesis sensor protein PhoR [Clostridium saccharobutylicum]AQS00196.1 alkaline phosphatase synthesis sensor protein PhoR [Clostridium saccharobutylicum]AQS09996.1 alkaline phosphatase synthesis sensor protein PhoR [Clostridium saccharobutylicum]AQS14179.1 alkaline phosphat
MNNLQKQVIYFSILLYTACLGFILYCIFVIKQYNIIKLSIIFSIIVILILNGFMFYINRYMCSILEKLTDLINGIMDGNEEEIFSALNDDLLSKLQNQTVKLTSILKSQNKALQEEKNKIQSLVTDMVHQLKNPFSNLKLYCELIKDKNISVEERKEFVSIINNQLEKFEFLMESMIKISRLESDIITLKLNQNSLDDICLASIKQVYEKAKNKNIEIEFISKEDISIFIDKKWTCEAIVNIIDNAVKYTNSNGKIIIKTNCFEMFAMIEIKDNGIGIEKEEINNIFKRFYRGNNVSTDEGAGIGLYLSRKIISKQNGFIKVKSERNKGSSVSVLLPLVTKM